MVQLSVNINKIATLRNSRGGLRPNPTEFALKAVALGVQGITIHPRPDERHITRQDVLDIHKALPSTVELNIEGYPDERFLEIIREVRPHQATLVPDPPGVLTSDAGWKVRENRVLLNRCIASIKQSGARVSLFMETDHHEILAAKEVGADRIEFYTGPYAQAFMEGRGAESFSTYEACAQYAQSLKLGINAGHDLDLNNLPLFIKLTGLDEVSIGHALICDALDLGFASTLQKYLQITAL